LLLISPDVRLEYHMPETLQRAARAFALAALLAAASAAVPAQEAGSRHLAPGFTTRPAASKLVVMPADMELFSISAGGVTEPRDDWTAAAQKHFGAALAAQKKLLGANVAHLKQAELEDFAEIAALHRAVADAIYVHHSRGAMALPTKNKRLDWSLGEAVKPLKDRTGADYALFTWVRDSYTSTERKAVMLGMALLGAITLGGEQIGYASLVDLNTGRVVWFNDMSRMWGDLRTAEPAAETLEALLKGFPGVQP
jgi:hypothetical protein